MSFHAHASGEDPDEPVRHPAEAEELRAVLYELKKLIVGQDYAMERVLVALIADGHCLLEGPPGLAKTLSVRALAHVVGGEFSRVQFTPDLVPSDIVGTRIYRSSQERFDVELGPVFANFVLADEINRAPAKVQAALLEVMAERQVTIGGESHPVPSPFQVLATQNPLESEGVYQLPEAQRDRFLFKVLMDYPNYREESEIVRRMTAPPTRLRCLLTPQQLLSLRQLATESYVDPAIADYAVRLVMATRNPESFGLPDLAAYLVCGASPRASIGMVEAARALALLRGRAYTVPGDVSDIAPDVLRHRLVLGYEAIADDVNVEALIDQILMNVPEPVRPEATRVVSPTASV